MHERTRELTLASHDVIFRCTLAGMSIGIAQPLGANAGLRGVARSLYVVDFHSALGASMPSDSDALAFLSYPAQPSAIGRFAN